MMTKEYTEEEAQAISERVNIAIKNAMVPLFKGLYRHLGEEGYPHQAIEVNMCGVVTELFASCILRAKQTMSNTDFTEEEVEEGITHFLYHALEEFNAHLKFYTIDAEVFLSNIKPSEREANNETSDIPRVH